MNMLFECKKIGVDTAKNNITRVTPIVVSCNYHENAEKEMRLYFTLTKEQFMYN